MNQEHFDDLTKALAAPVSRARMLKMLGGAFLGSALGGWGLLGWTDNAEAKKKKHKHRHCPPGTVPHKKGKKVKCIPIASLPTGPCTQFILDANGDPTPNGTCQNPSTTTILLTQASQDLSYSKLADYLANNGFTADGNPAAGVFEKEGTLDYSLLVSTYSNPTRTNEVTALHYVVLATGESTPFAFVWDTQQETLLYMLVFDGTKTVQRVDPPASTQQAGIPSADPSITANTCDEAKLRIAVRVAALAALNCVPITCSEHLLPPNPVKYELCVAKCGAAFAGAVEAAILAFGCPTQAISVCDNGVCCGWTETGCPPNTCCPSGQECCGDGTCAEKGKCKCKPASDSCSSDDECCSKLCCFGVCCEAGGFCSSKQHICCNPSSSKVCTPNVPDLCCLKDATCFRHNEVDFGDLSKIRCIRPGDPINICSFASDGVPYACIQGNTCCTANGQPGCHQGRCCIARDWFCCPDGCEPR